MELKNEGKYLKALREIETHIRSTHEPMSYIIQTLNENLPEHQVVNENKNDNQRRDTMYFITGMKHILNENTRFDSKEAQENDTRCYGYFKDKEEAIEAVKRNTLDMHETMYTYIVIEEVEEGIHPVSEIVQWFEYKKETNTYEPIEVGRTGFCNYSIG